jgi:hypothetical protein
VPEEPKTPPEQKPGMAPREGSENGASDGLPGGLPKTWDEVFAHPRFMELKACREPGCLDMSTHMIAVVRRR